LSQLKSNFEEFEFDFTDNPIPANSADVFLTVVYRGVLGLENDGLLLGGKDLFEPDPLDRGNITDYDCFQGQLQYVMNLSPYRYPDHTERDVNQDRLQDLFGPGLRVTPAAVPTLPRRAPGMREQDSGARGLTRRTASSMIVTNHP
jgi:hypothetical protein